MKRVPRFRVKEREEEAVLMDVVSAVIDVAQNDREVIAVVLQMLRSGSIRFRGLHGGAR